MNYATKAGAALVAALALSGSAAQASQRVTEIPLRAEFAVPGEIVKGPDGAMYASDSSLGKVWRISDAGKVRSFDVGGGATGIASAHGALWVSERDGSQIVKLGLDGSKTAYPVTPGAFPSDIVLGPDGALWFTESRGNAIGRLTIDGSSPSSRSRRPTRSSPTSRPARTARCGSPSPSEQDRADHDRRRRSPSSRCPARTACRAPIVAGPDGALWFAERNGNKIGRMTTDGVLTNEFPLPTENANPLAMVVGPDGALYFTQHSANTIARMTLDGVVTKEFRIPSGSPDGLAVGPDGDLWFTQGNWGQVGRVDLRWDPPIRRDRHDVRDEALGVGRAHRGDVHRRRPGAPLRRHDQVGRRLDVGRVGPARRQRLRGPRPAHQTRRRPTR